MFGKIIEYMVGGKEEGKGLPVDVRLSLDAEFKRTIIKSVFIGSAGIALGIAAGIVISESDKPRGRRRRRRRRIR